MHAVRARPLPAIKNNIEPDEHREEADTIPTRGVTPETPRSGLTPYAMHFCRLTLRRFAPSLRARAYYFHVQGILCHGVGLSPTPAYWLPPLRALLFASLARGFLMFARKGELSCPAIT